MVKNNPLEVYFCTYIRRTVNRILLFSSFIVISILLSGCVTFYDPESSQEYNSDNIGSVSPQSTVGQTITSRRPSLNGITIWITIPSPEVEGSTKGNNYHLTADLFDTAAQTSPLSTTTISLPPTGRNLPVTFIFPLNINSPEKNYYLQLSSTSSAVQINGRNDDAYPYGQAYLNRQPIESDIAFRLSYDYGLSSFAQDLSSTIKKSWVLLPLFAVVFLPGWILMDVSKLRVRFDTGEQVAISIGISLAISPLLMLWTTNLNILWSKLSLLFLSAALTIIFLFRLTKSYQHGRKDNISTNDPSQDRPLITPDYKDYTNPLVTSFLIIIFIITLAIRMIMVRDFATPAWVDSVHHALLTRLIMDQGAYPQSYLPYLDISPTEYHPGFHSIAAAFTWLSGLGIDQSLLILGQFLNALIIFSVYLLSKTFMRSPTAGVLAAAIAGFFTPMPAYYTSWGRYTELTGLLILPSVFVFMKLISETHTFWEKAWAILLISITSAGLFLVHYRVLVFLSLLTIAYLFVYYPTNKQVRSNYFSNLLLPILISVGISILFVLPWFIQTIKSALVPTLSAPIKNNIPYFQDFSWANLTAAFGIQSLVLAGLGLLWGMIRQKRSSVLIIIWVVLLFLSANLGALHLPGSGLISNLSVEIMLFIPISILGGYFIDRIIKYWVLTLPTRIKFPFLVLFTIIFGYTSFLGAKQLLTIINPVTILSRKADIRAIEWVDKNIPEGEKIIINPLAWGYGLYSGSDGGYWIAPLSGRQTLPPAVLYGLSDRKKEISDQIQTMINFSSNPNEINNFMVANGYRYFFIGAKGGILSPHKLLSSNHFSLIYYQDGVWIFSRKP